MKAKYLIPLGLGAVGGAVLAFTKPGRQTTKAVRAAFHRKPAPTFVAPLPVDEEGFAALDDAVCQCGREVAERLDPFDDATAQAYLAEVRRCAWDRLVPGLTSPPVPGDHPTVAQMFTILSHEISRRALEGRLCIPEEELEDTGVMPDNL